MAVLTLEEQVRARWVELRPVMGAPDDDITGHAAADGMARLSVIRGLVHENTGWISSTQIRRVLEVELP